MIDKKQNTKELHALRKEIKELRRYKAVVEKQKTVRGKFNSFIMRVWVGNDLNSAFRNFLTPSSKESGMVPVEETADLAAALVRRVIRVGLVAILLALIPSALFFWQNLIMKAQNQSLITQIEAQRSATANEQVTGYFGQLLSNDETERLTALSYFVSDISLKQEVIERLSYLFHIGNNEQKCLTLGAVTSLLRAERTLVKTTLSDVILVGQPIQTGLDNDIVTPIADINSINCDELDFADIDFGGPINIWGSTLKQARFDHANLSQVRFNNVSMPGSTFDEVQICDHQSRSCVELLAVDLSNGGVFRLKENVIYSEMRKEIFERVILKRSALGVTPAIVINDLARGDFQNGVISPILNDAVCLPIEVAFDCYEHYRGVDEVLNYSTPKPNLCPDNLQGPIIGYIDGEEEWCSRLLLSK